MFAYPLWRRHLFPVRRVKDQKNIIGIKQKSKRIKKKLIGITKLPPETCTLINH